MLLHGVKGEAEKLMLFAATLVQVSTLEMAVKVSWELDLLPVGEPEILLSGSSVRGAARDSEKLRVLSLYPSVCNPISLLRLGRGTDRLRDEKNTFSFCCFLLFCSLVRGNPVRRSWIPYREIDKSHCTF
jgi:hypothetical protein